MPKVAIYGGGAIQRQGVTDAKLRPAEFGASPLAAGLEVVAKAAPEWADRQQKIEDIYDETDAKKLELEHIERTRAIRKTVREALGSNARPAAQAAAAELQEYNKELIARARSPMAARMLEESVVRRTSAEVDSYDTYAHSEFVKDRNATSEARKTSLLQEAADAPDEDTAIDYLTQAMAEVDADAEFNGLSDEIRVIDKLKLTTSFRVSRARAIARDQGPTAAREYVMANKGEIADDATQQFMDATQNEHLEEWAENFEDSAPQATEVPEPITEPRTETMLDPGQGFQLTSDMGPRSAPKLKGGGHGSSFHKGNDYGMPVGTPIRAAWSGRVAFAADASDGYGNKVVLDHGGGRQTLYAHQSRFTVKPGTVVKKGDIIGYSGQTGNASGPHLHFEIRQDGNPINPSKSSNRVAKVNPGGTGRVAAVADDDSDIEANTSLSFAQKKALRQVRERRQSQARQERNDAENEADRAAMRAMFEMGDGFTSVSQLPNGGVGLSPSFALQVQKSAKANRSGENIEVSPQTLFDLEYIRWTNPKVYATETFWKSQVGKVPNSMLQSMAQEAGSLAGQSDAQKAKEITRSTLWGVAKDALLPAGVDLSKVEKNPKVAERKLKYLQHLEQQANIWAQQNPGKQPTEQTMRIWVGNSLRKTTDGTYFFEMDDDRVFRSISEHDKRAIIQAHRRKGLPFDQASILRTYRAQLAYSPFKAE